MAMAQQRGVTGLQHICNVQVANHTADGRNPAPADRC